MPDSDLLLVPGTLCDEALWRHQIDHLGDVARISVVNHRLDPEIDVIARRTLDGAPERFALAGLSMGGFVALSIALMAPDRVTRLCLMATTARADSPRQAQRRRDLVDLARRGNFKGVTPRMLPYFVHPGRVDDEPLRSDILAMGERVGLEAYLNQQRANAGRPDRRADLGRIRCPTLVVCGRQDILLPPEQSEEIAAGIPDATLVMVEDCGHLPTMERPQAVTALMRYWLLRG